MDDRARSFCASCMPGSEMEGPWADPCLRLTSWGTLFFCLFFALPRPRPSPSLPSIRSSPPFSAQQHEVIGSGAIRCTAGTWPSCRRPSRNRNPFRPGELGITSTPVGHCYVTEYLPAAALVYIERRSRPQYHHSQFTSSTLSIPHQATIFDSLLNSTITPLQTQPTISK